MTIAVGSKNPTKINAVREAYKLVWPDETIEIITIDSPSGVSNQPVTDKESIKGATNRAKHALKNGKADFGVGLEGGIQKVGNEYFDCGWIVVIDKKGNRGIGSSIRMQTPPIMIKMIHEQNLELGVINDILFNTKNSKQATGHFGLMTKDALTRTSAYRDGVISALTRFIHPRLYE